MKNIILIGKPGSGKGTMSKLLLEHDKSYVHLSTGDVFRNHIKNQTDLGLEILDVMNSGELVNDELTIAVVEDFIDKNKNKNIIFDGFPRNVNQAEWLIKELQESEFELLNIFVEEDLAIQRIQSRSVIENRTEDSDISIIKKRLSDYVEITSPILHWYHEFIDDVIFIDGSSNPTDCFKIIKEKLSL